MIDPAENLAASVDDRAMNVAVDPLCAVTAAAACAPAAAADAQLAGASRFRCCEPVARAIVNFVQLRNSKLTCASSVSRTCSCVPAGIPVNTAAVLLPGLRVNS